MWKCFEVVETKKNFEGDWAQLWPKLCLFRQSWTKYLIKAEKSSKIRHQRKNSDICFCMFFDCYWQSLISGRETGHWAISPPKFAICEATPIRSLLYHISSFVLLVANQNCTKKLWSSYNQECVKILLLSSTFPKMIELSAKIAYFASKIYFYQKSTNKKSWKLYKVKFWP